MGSIYIIPDMRVDYIFGTGDENETTFVYDLGASNSSDVVIAKSELEGDLVWAERVGGADNERINLAWPGDSSCGVAPFSDGALLVAGSFDLVGDFDSEADTRVHLLSEGYTDGFIAKYTP